MRFGGKKVQLTEHWALREQGFHKGVELQKKRTHRKSSGQRGYYSEEGRYGLPEWIRLKEEENWRDKKAPLFGNCIGCETVIGLRMENLRRSEGAAHGSWRRKS